MLRIRVPKKVTALLLLIAMISLCVYSSYEYPKNLPYPTVDEIVSNYQKNVGEKISIFGTVTRATSDTSVVSTGKSIFEVKPMMAKVGDKAEILGTLELDYQIRAESVLVYDGPSYYSIFARSLIGAGLLILIFLKNWKFKFKVFKFVERE